MTLQVEIQDLRRMLKEKCEEIISDKKLAYEFYCRICEIEEDDRFRIVDNLQEAVPVIQREVMNMLVWCCGSCGTAITDGDKFCRMCGRKVKWND